MRVLLFKNPTVHPGLNVTVRYGSKWADVVAGERLAIAETPVEGGVEPAPIITEVFAIGATQFAGLDHIPEVILGFEHDSTCRTLAGLTVAMDRAYGEGNWGADGVTVLLFWV